MRESSRGSIVRPTDLRYTSSSFPQTVPSDFRAFQVVALGHKGCCHNRLPERMTTTAIYNLFGGTARTVSNHLRFAVRNAVSHMQESVPRRVIWLYVPQASRLSRAGYSKRAGVYMWPLEHSRAPNPPIREVQPTSLMHHVRATAVCSRHDRLSRAVLRNLVYMAVGSRVLLRMAAGTMRPHVRARDRMGHSLLVLVIHPGCPPRC